MSWNDNRGIGGMEQSGGLGRWQALRGQMEQEALSGLPQMEDLRAQIQAETQGALDQALGGAPGGLTPFGAGGPGASAVGKGQAQGEKKLLADLQKIEEKLAQGEALSEEEQQTLELAREMEDAGYGSTKLAQALDRIEGLQGEREEQAA